MKSDLTISLNQLKSCHQYILDLLTRLMISIKTKSIKSHSLLTVIFELLLYVYCVTAQN